MAYTILYIATSADGFIADKNGGLDWLPQEEIPGEDYGFETLIQSIDAIAQGSKTFLQTISFIESGLVTDLPYGGKPMYVFTRHPLTTTRTDVTFVSDAHEYITKLQIHPEFKRVWLVGGAETIRTFKEHNLIDECIITIIPTKIYDGIALPPHTFDNMKEVSLLQYPSGIQQRIYKAESLVHMKNFSSEALDGKK